MLLSDKKLLNFNKRNTHQRKLADINTQHGKNIGCLTTRGGIYDTGDQTLIGIGECKMNLKKNGRLDMDSPELIESNKDYDIRVIRPYEVHRLMGLSDQDFKYFNHLPKGQVMLHYGNSIVVNVLEIIFKELLKDSKRQTNLYEAFAGYGSQHYALNRIGADFKSVGFCEWGLHQMMTNIRLNYIKDVNCCETDDDIYGEFKQKIQNGELVVSTNTKTPSKTLSIKNSPLLTKVINEINSGFIHTDITKIKGEDLGNRNIDIFTYSFPCQDISVAGNGKGFEKGEGTRSGLLWEVERLLNEIVDDNGCLPRVLLMENVKAIQQKKHLGNFEEWIETLELLGYKSTWKVLNATEFGIPQNRERCFMVSIHESSDFGHDFSFDNLETKELKTLSEFVDFDVTYEELTEERKWMITCEK